MRENVYTPWIRRFTDEKAYDLAETQRLYSAVSAAYRNSPTSNPSYPADLSAQIYRDAIQLVNIPNYEPLLDALDACVNSIFQKESVLFDLPPFPQYLSMKEGVDFRQFLRAKQHFLANEERVIALFSKTILNLFAGLIDAFSKVSFQPSAATVPLFTILPKVNELADSIIGTFCDDELSDAGLFAELQTQLYINVYDASGVPLDKPSSKRLITAAQSDLPPKELLTTYLGGTPLLNLFFLSVPFGLNQETRFSGHWIIAPPGMGKTNLLHSMFLEDMSRDASIILMDSTGGLIDPVRDMAEIQDRLIIVDPDSEYPLALNPLDIPHSNSLRTIDLLEYFFSALLEAKLTALQKTLFRNLLSAIVQCIPKPTLATFREITEHGFDKYRHLLTGLPATTQRFLETQFNSKTYHETRQQLIWRLDFLLTNPLLNAMFNSPETKFDIGKEMDAGKIIVINNSKSLLGDEGAELFGRFFIALVLSAAQQRSTRPRHQKLPCFFYIDECHTVIRRDERIATILDECRSQNIALILAHQRLQQISDTNVLSALQNCAIRMANSDEDARALAPSLRTTAESLQSLDIGQFAVWSRDLRSQPAVSVNVPYTDLRDRPRLSSAGRQMLRDRMHLEFCNAPSPPALNAPQPAPAPAAEKPPKRSLPPDDSEFGPTY